MKIFETGFDADVLREILEASGNGDQIISVGLNIAKMQQTREALYDTPFLHHILFLLQDPCLLLSKTTWADEVYLDSDLNLQDTVEEFRLAASTGAKKIQIKNYQHKAALAVAEAVSNGWTVSYREDRAILVR